MSTDICGNTSRQKRHTKGSRKETKTLEIQRMWNMKYVYIPVVNGATGIVTRGLRKNLEAIPGKHSIHLLQKTAILGTPHIIRKVLQSET
jgi:hypothetical protein